MNLDSCLSSLALTVATAFFLNLTVLAVEVRRSGLRVDQIRTMAIFKFCKQPQAGIFCLEESFLTLENKAYVCKQWISHRYISSYSRRVLYPGAL